MAESRRVEVIVDVNVGKIDMSGADVDGEVSPGGGGGGGGDSMIDEAVILLPRLIAGLKKLAGMAAAAGRVLAAVFSNPLVIAGVIALGTAVGHLVLTLGALKLAAKAANWIITKLWEGFKSLAKYIVGKALEAVKRFISEGLQRLKQWGRDAIDTFADFEQQVANTTTVLGAFGDESEAMRDRVGQAARDISLASKFAAGEIAGAAYDLASAGFDATQSINALRGSVVLAEATLSNLKLTTETVAATINQFGLDASASTDIANLFAGAISKSPATMEKLRSAFEYVGSTAASFEVSVNETTAAVMALFKVGRVGSRAGTELANVFNSLSKQTDKATKALAQYGIDIKQLTPAKAGLTEIVRRFEELRDMIGQKEFAGLLQKAFTQRAARGLVGLVQVGSKEIEKMQKAVTGTNTAFQMQQDQLRTLSGAFKILKSDLVEIALTITKPVGEGLRLFLVQLHEMNVALRRSGVFERFREALSGVSKLLNDLGENIKFVAKRQVPYLLDVLGTRLRWAIESVQRSLPDLMKGFEKMVAGFSWALQKALSPEVMDATGRAVSGLGEAMQAMITPQFITAVGEAAEAFADMMVQISSDVWTRFVDSIPDLLKGLTRLAESAPEALGRLPDLLERTMEWALRLGKDGFPLLGRAIRAFGQLALSGASNVQLITKALMLGLAPALNAVVGALGMLGGVLYVDLFILEKLVRAISFLPKKLAVKLGLQGVADNMDEVADNLEQNRKSIGDELDLLAIGWYQMVQGMKRAWDTQLPIDEMSQGVNRLGREVERLGAETPKGKGSKEAVPANGRRRGANGQQQGFAAVIGPFYVNDLGEVGRVAQGVADRHARQQEIDARVRGR